MVVAAMSDKEILLVYDHECPLCDNYCRMVRIRESIGTLKLVDARQPGAIVDEITRAGLDIDQGMVLKLDDALYYGTDAIHMLSLISSPSTVFNRLNYAVFKHKRAAALLYPVLRSGRNLLLKLLGKTKINNLKIAGNDRF